MALPLDDPFHGWCSAFVAATAIDCVIGRRCNHETDAISDAATTITSCRTASSMARFRPKNRRPPRLIEITSHCAVDRMAHGAGDVGIEYLDHAVEGRIGTSVAFGATPVTIPGGRVPEVVPMPPLLIRTLPVPVP